MSDDDYPRWWKFREANVSTTKWIEQIRAAMDSLDTWDIPEQHRKTVRRCLTAEYVEAEERWDEAESTSRSGKKWTAEEELELDNLLTGVVATSWEEERVILARAGAVLKRPEKTVKKKAIERGFARAVDHWLNVPRR